MKLSVFVVTYNQEKYIRQCLDGILMQKVDFDYEVVIGEDHGTDGTRAICEEYAAKYPQIRLLPLTENLGVAGNWRRVLLECKGEYVAMCEGDDYWLDDNKLQKQVDFLDRNPKYSGCFHNANKVDGNGRVLGVMHNSNMCGEYNFDNMVSRWFVPTASLLFRQNSTIISGFSELAQYSHYSADRLLLALLSNESNIAYMPCIMSVWRRNNACLSLSSNNVDIFKGNIDLFSAMKSYFPNGRKKILSKRIFEWHGELALEYYKQGKYLNYANELLITFFYIRTLIDFKTWIKNYLLRK